ncbi:MULTISPECIES: cyclophilin-like fold protein [unclassified Adlercreutzia]|uniref:cyclophilin-like fold protein n=1 Tax=unclassified Adlercreutzia TaxID=2636013 RepID=UPI0013EBBB3B|nr:MULTISPECIES: cyclophilin-like fold protein [unclassified Adlercreutzia]
MKVQLEFGDTKAVFATLNNTETAKAFAEALPVTLHVGSSGMDFCGQIGMRLPYTESQVHNGWKNGQLNYNPEGGWLAVFYGGEEQSSAYGDQVVMGQLDDGEIEKLRQLGSSYDLTIKAV